MRRTVPYAFNPALNTFGDGMGVPVFVRPDCPPEDAGSASAAHKKEKRSKVAAQRARPQFRSALEQVCYLRPCMLSCCSKRSCRTPSERPPDCGFWMSGLLYGLDVCCTLAYKQALMRSLYVFRSAI